MTATLLEGKKIAASIKEQLKKEIKQLNSAGTTVSLAAVQVGENASSRVYINKQKATCEELGIKYELRELPADTSQQKLIEFVEQLNRDDSVTGIILQMPLPEQIDARQVQTNIAADKDVEAMNPANMGKLMFGDDSLAPCTAKAAVEILKSSGVELKGKEAVVVGHSEIVGKPIAVMLLSSQTASPTPTVCHIATKDLAFHTRRADIIFVAVGIPGFIKADMVKEGVIIIDIGINRVPVLDENGNAVLNDKGRPKKKTVGDVDFEAVSKKAAMITPVPGGVGPVTTAILLKNTVEAAKKIAAKK